jgi:hypothetical protein
MPVRYHRGFLEVSGNVFNGYGRNGVGSWFRDHEFEATHRPRSAFTVTSGLRVNRAVNAEQWVEKFADVTDHYDQFLTQNVPSELRARCKITGASRSAGLWACIRPPGQP